MEMLLASVLAAAGVALAGRLPALIASRTKLGADFGRCESLRHVFGMLLVVVLTLNANLWLPMHVVATVLAVAALVSVALNFKRRGLVAVGRFELEAIVIASVGVSSCALWALFQMADWWLLEGPNHDSLFYYEGAAWAWQYALRAEPIDVASTWGLGVCRQGGVFIGTDCTVLRNGTYSMLALASALNRPASANEVQAAASFAAVLPAMATVALTKHETRTRWRWLIAATAAVMVFLAPGSVSALTNANVGTVFGAAAVAMTLGLALAPYRSPYQRAVVLGMSTALAGHLYGEAAAVAGVIAAFGVAGDALRLRRPLHIVTGGLTALVVCLLGLNVVAADLVRSFLAVSEVAKGGDWASWYIHASPLAWIAAPFGGILLGLDPEVSPLSVVLGATLSCLVVALGLASPRTRLMTSGVVAVSVLLVAYVEIRGYAYGEHKVVQMLGPLASMLAVAIALVGVRGAGRRRTRKVLYGMLVALLIVSLFATGLRASALLRDWAPLHGLSPGFTARLAPIGSGDLVLLDDTGSVGVERFQKAHYLGFLLHARGARVLMPALDDEPLRGGYLRGSRGSSFDARMPRWIIQATSQAGARSPFAYPPNAVQAGSEFQLVDMLRAPAALAAGNGWHQCEPNHCWTKAEFDIDVAVAPSCVEPHLEVKLDFFAPPAAAKVRIFSSLASKEISAKPGVIVVPLPRQKSRTTFAAGWILRSPAGLGQSADTRKLFARVESVSVRCTAR